MKPLNWKDYLSFSKKERVAVFILLTLIFLLIIIPYLIPTAKQQIVIEELSGIDSLNVVHEPLKEADKEVKDSNTSTAQTNAKDIAVFYFDPNTVDEAGLRKLGLNEKTVSTILHYRLKGGQFRKPDDLKKIYSLSPKDVDRLLPYVRIEANIPAKPEGIKSDYSKVEAKKLQPIHINTATAEDFMLLPGIGGVLSKRIIHFRDKLGMFNSVDQIAKIYGLPDSTFQKIKPYLVLD